jgi:hypothetical protein
MAAYKTCSAGDDDVLHTVYLLFFDVFSVQEQEQTRRELNHI